MEQDNSTQGLLKSERIVLGVEYDGSSYHGWQRQSHAASAQSTLEEALSSIADQKIEVTCAGRTDSGVHATSQVVHFDSTNIRPEKAWLKGTNSLLPRSISIQYAQKVSENFHARFSATSRSYIYIIDNSHVRPAIMGQGLTWYNKRLDVDKMDEACEYFLGEQDFSSFRSSRCQANSANRCITNLSCRRLDNYVVIEISANAFLHHMVRNIVGVLFEIGDGRRKDEWVKVVIDRKDRTKSGVTAPAFGLYLVGVTYPEEFNIPSNMKAPMFLQQILSIK
ncbi:MAG: tRNA pseudouridine(38-40) synthase TruA [Gammaproteobacteria bacterium]|nr:tRNA pseudouridine(38-40) synthase TruA [Gammaproteobacteria bacterium]